MSTDIFVCDYSRLMFMSITIESIMAANHFFVIFCLFFLYFGYQLEKI